LGLASSANASDNFVLAEPVHGSAPDIAGRGIANPCAAILAAAQLLDSLGEELATQRIRQAVHRTLADGILSADLGGRATTVEVTNAVIERLMLDLVMS
jgi:isocitrate/isopropylmalate dehydrogenase